jgi:polysaccharide deacetylase family protein (PEP-CTERM system associated)
MKKHILTIAVEDYFHVAALRGAIRRKHWERLEPRLEANLDDVLVLLDRYGARATFFVFGWIADSQPHLIRRIVEQGHEVASRGYWPRGLRGVLRADFLDDLRRAKEALENAGSNRIVGYRAAAWIREEDRWILDVLAEEGYAYDSSINPILRRFASDP